MSVVKIAVEIDGDLIIQDIKTRIGVFTQKGQVLFSIKDTVSGKVTKIKSQTAGKSMKLLKKNGQSVSKG